MSIEETMQKDWSRYLREVLPDDASAVQVRECRRAFLAGMTSGVCHVYEAHAVSCKGMGNELLTLAAIEEMSGESEDSHE